MLRLGVLLSIFLMPYSTAVGAESPPPSDPWVDSVELLITEPEKRTYLTLGETYQKEAFIKEFWRRRDPFPNTARNELRDRWEERRLTLPQLYDFQDDRALAFLLHGEPAAKLRSLCGSVLRPMEIWTWPESPFVSGPVVGVFLRKGKEHFDLWPGQSLLRSLLFMPVANQDDRAVELLIEQECPRGSDLLNQLYLARQIDNILDLGRLSSPNPEWAKRFQERSTFLPNEATAFPSELYLQFPAERQSRTEVDINLVIDPDFFSSPEKGALKYVVDGEFLRHGHLFESFRYRFEFSPEPSLLAKSLSLQLERYLRPGDYLLALKIHNLVEDTFSAHRQMITVPKAAPSPTQELAPSTEDYWIEILPPPPGLLTGKVRLWARLDREGAHRVSFELDGKTIMSRRRPPWSVELNLDRSPRRHTVRAVVEDAEGQELASDSLDLNVGPHRFNLRLIEPQSGAGVSTDLRAHARVEVPEGEHLDRVEFFVDEERQATLYQPPFIQPLTIEAPNALTFVRAAAYLQDGASVEDIVFVNNPFLMENIDVQMVELYTTVQNRKGKAYPGLRREQVQVLEDKVPQKIERFEWVQDRPVHAGILLDTSTSMEEELEEAQKAAVEFLNLIMTEKDRAAVITFADTPFLAARFSNDLDLLESGLSDLEAEGETAFYDSLIYSLYYFGGVKGRRFLVILSDGEDVSSEYTWEETLEFVRRSGVTLYTIGLKLDRKASRARTVLSRLAEETGGGFFQIQSAMELGRIYKKIQEELRSQYLITYQSNQQEAEDYRKVEVEVDDSSLEVKTLRGYYPQ